MLLIRFATKTRWLNEDGQPHDANNPAAIQEACNNLILRDDETGLSLFKVADEVESRRIAAIFALTQRQNPGPVFYLLVDEQLLQNAGTFTLNLDNPQDLPKELSERHCNQSEFADQTFRTNAACHILTALASSTSATSIAISKTELITFIQQTKLHQDPQISPHINSPSWKTCLGI